MNIKVSNARIVTLPSVQHENTFVQERMEIQTCFQQQ